MIKTTVFDIKTHFSDYLAKAVAGENVVIYEKNVPIAELHRTSIGPKPSRPIGLAKKQLNIPSSFFDDLPADLLDSFNGSNE